MSNCCNLWHVSVWCCSIALHYIIGYDWYFVCPIYVHVCSIYRYTAYHIFGCVLASDTSWWWKISCHFLSFFDRSSLKGSWCCKAVTKPEHKLFCSPFQTMEIRTLMLQIRRTSHRNSFYGSGKMQMISICSFHSLDHTETLRVQLASFLTSSCCQTVCALYVFVPLDHRKATSLPHHHPFGLFLGRS